MPGFSPETTPDIPGEHRSLDRRLRRFLAWAVLLITASYCFLAYWSYSKAQHADPASWQRLAAGQGIAPAQYRMGIYFTANFLSRVMHLPFRYIFTASDFVCLGFSLAVLLVLLTRMPVFREAEHATQWALVLLALLLTQFYLGWTLWFQEPETMPSLAILSASALLTSGVLRVPRFMLVLSLLLVATLGCTIRVDAVIAFHAGFLIAVVANRRDTFAIARVWQAGTSIAALLLAAALEHFIAHTLFPHVAREAALIQLPVNFYSPNGLMVLLLSLFTWAITVWLAARQWRLLTGWAHALIFGSLIYFALFMTFGMSEEVRIFLPFVILLLPLSVPLLLKWFRGEAA